MFLQHCRKLTTLPLILSSCYCLCHAQSLSPDKWHSLWFSVLCTSCSVMCDMASCSHVILSRGHLFCGSYLDSHIYISCVHHGTVTFSHPSQTRRSEGEAQHVLVFSVCWDRGWCGNVRTPWRNCSWIIEKRHTYYRATSHSLCTVMCIALWRWSEFGNERKLSGVGFITYDWQWQLTLMRACASACLKKKKL